MKKLLCFSLVSMLAVSLFAEESPVVASIFGDDKDQPINEVFEENARASSVPRKNSGIWPAFFAVGEIPYADKTPDIMGLRLTIPFSTKHDSVTGFDLGLWGRAQYFEGFMLSILRNDVRDQFTGFQVGLYNSVAQADLFAVQVGLWNDAMSIRGLQVGIINNAEIAQGFQIGLINRAEELYGFQVGLINVIRSAELQFCPVINIGF